MKKCILSFIVGIVLTSGIVYAYQYTASTINYVPKNREWQVSSVQEAIDDLKSNGSLEKICELKTGSKYEIGSKYECNPSLDGTTKYDFYILKVEGDFVKLIMDRNISDTVGSVKTMNWKPASNFYRNGAGKNLNWKVAVELPDVQDIADAIGNTSWNVADKNDGGYFSIDSQHNWLYNNCNYSNGYWTANRIIPDGDGYNRVWGVYSNGNLYAPDYSNNSNLYGMRPVIIVHKLNLK